MICLYECERRVPLADLMALEEMVTCWKPPHSLYYWALSFLDRQQKMIGATEELKLIYSCY